jgi:hypothetical protein
VFQNGFHKGILDTGAIFVEIEFGVDDVTRIPKANFCKQNNY